MGVNDGQDVPHSISGLLLSDVVAERMAFEK